MRVDNINGCSSIDSFVHQKLNRLNATDRSFQSLFELMFSEGEATLHERSQGYKIVKTTYRQAHDNALRRAACLQSLLPQQPKDSVVAIHMENGVEWIETFWAVLAAGFCPLLMNLRLDEKTLHGALEDTGAVAVIADGGSFPVATIVHTDLLNGDQAAPSGAFGSEIFVMSTGTTSNLKICGYGSQEFACLVNDSVDIIKNCVQIKKHYNGQIKLLTFLPFYHVFGLIAVYIWFAFFSRTLVHLQDMEPQTVLNTIRRHEVTHIFAVPLFWERIYDQAIRAIRDRGEKTFQKYEKGVRIANKLDGLGPVARLFKKIAFREVREQMFGESVLFMITGGSPIRSEALAFFNNIGYHLANGYGMTEIGITSVEQSMNARQRNSGSVGQSMTSVRYMVDENGELLVKGPSLARSIRQGGKLTLRGEDWFHTGDLAACRNGSYHILGRKDDVILLANGEMLNPNLVEPWFLQPGIDGACLINASSQAVEPALLLAVKRTSTRPQLEAIQEKVLQQLKAHKLDTHIRKLVFVPGSLLGENDFKLNRSALKRKYLAGELGEITLRCAPEQAPKGELESQVAAIFAAVLNKNPEDIGLDADFFMDEGGTSLDYFAMLSGLKDSYSLPFQEGQAGDFHTIRGICRYIEGAQNAD